MRLSERAVGLEAARLEVARLADGKCGVEGESVDLGGRRVSKKKTRRQLDLCGHKPIVREEQQRWLKDAEAAAVTTADSPGVGLARKEPKGPPFNLGCKGLGCTANSKLNSKLPELSAAARLE